MSALSGPSIRQSMTDQTLFGLPMAAVKAYQGGLAVIAGGYVRPGYVATGLIALGIFDFSGDVLEGTMDNSGGNPGDLTARVRAGTFLFANYGTDPVVATDRGLPCFIHDDNTVSHTDAGGTKSVAGVVVAVESRGVWVRVGSVNGTSLAAEIAARQALAADLALATGTTLAGTLGAKQVATVGDANVVGGIPVSHRIAVADGATADIDVVLTYKTMVTGVKVIKTTAAGGASDTITVKNAATAITNAIDINVADKTTVHESTIDDAQMTINAGGTLRITRTKASAENVACIVIVSGLRVA
jgi:hypothetical protein